MTPEVRTVTALSLFAVSLGSAIASAVCLFRAERSPRSQIAARLIEYEREIEDPLFYSPETDLLDEPGKHLRRTGRRLASVAAVAILLLSAFATLSR